MSMIAFDRWVGSSLEVSRAVIEAAFRDEFLAISPDSVVPELRLRGGAVVSLVKGEQLRGSAGTFWGFHRFMGAEVAWAAVQAAFNDRRFEPLAQWELSEVEVVVDLVYDQSLGGPADIGPDSTCLVQVGERQLLVTPPPATLQHGRSIDEARARRLSTATAGEDQDREGAFDRTASEQLIGKVGRAAAAGDWDSVRRLLDEIVDTEATARIWVAPLRRSRAEFGDIPAVSSGSVDRCRQLDRTASEAQLSSGEPQPLPPKQR